MLVCMVKTFSLCPSFAKSSFKSRLASVELESSEDKLSTPLLGNQSLLFLLAGEYSVYG